jgi:E3 ubiquitin-protein ligase MYCBP2
VNVDEGSSEGSLLVKKVEETEPNVPSTKKRMFKAKKTDSSGLRVRSHPTLQSEQLGQIPLNGVIGFTNEIHNDDGIWVKLDEESFHKFCQNTNIFQREGWCLQFNQHIGKTFLFPIDPPKPLPGLQGDTVRKSLEENFPNADSRFLN